MFRSRAYLHGPAGHLLWDLGANVMLAELDRLLYKCFGTADQAEHFQMELRTGKHKPDREL